MDPYESNENAIILHMLVFSIQKENHWFALIRHKKLFFSIEQSAYMSFLGSENFSARWIQKKNSNDTHSMPINCFFTSLYEKV